MSQSPVEMLLEKKAQAVFTFTFNGTATGGVLTICCAGLGGFLGLLGAKLGGDFGDFGSAVGGALGTSLGVILLTRILMCWPTCGIVGTALWFAVGAVSAGALGWYIDPHDRWPFLRWVLCGLLNGALLSPMHAPRLFGAAGKIPEIHGAGAVLAAIMNLLALLLSKFKHRLPAILVAGGLGSLLGSWIPALVSGAFANKELEEIFGSSITIPIAVVILSVVGGVVGGWFSWKQSLQPILAELATQKISPP